MSNKYNSSYPITSVGVRFNTPKDILKNNLSTIANVDNQDPFVKATSAIHKASPHTSFADSSTPVPYRDYNSWVGPTKSNTTSVQPKAATSAQPRVTQGQSYNFIDWLKQNNPELASYLARKAIASKYGISGYVGNAELNMRLWNALKEEAQKTPAESTALRLPVDTTSIKTMASLPLPTILVTPSYSTQTLPGRGGTADISASFYNAANNRLAFLTPRFRTNYFNLFQ